MIRHFVTATFGLITLTLQLVHIVFLSLHLFKMLSLQSFPSCSVPIKETTVISCIDVNDQTTCYNASSKYNNVTVNETSSSVISTMVLPPNYKFSTCVVFEYISGLIFESTLVTISKYIILNNVQSK